MSGIGEARIRVPDRVVKGDLIVVNAIISHPMDTGFFRDADGQPIPAYFIKGVVVTYGDLEVARFMWTSGISRDPIVSFTLKADREAPVTMTWTDNRGGVFRQSADIKFVSARSARASPSSYFWRSLPAPRAVSCPSASLRRAFTPWWVTPDVVSRVAPMPDSS